MRNPIVRSARFSRLTARLIAIFSFVGLLYGPSPALAQLGAADGFAALGTTAVTCTNSTVSGDVGVDSATGVITTTLCPVAGTVYPPGDSVVMTAYNDFLTAYAAYGALTCDATLTTLSGQTLLPGVYCVTAAATEGGVLTLDGTPADTWVFKIGAALTGTGFQVRMRDGANLCNNNVFWRTGAAVTLTGSTFLGRILAGADITTTGTLLRGQALANGAQNATGAVTFTTGTSVAMCAASPTTTTTLPPTTTTTLKPRPRVCEDDEDHRYHHKWKRGEDQRHEHRGRGEDRDRKYCKEHHPRRKSKGRR